ncbi:MAG TPA: hypothetical protein VF316_24900 [Polyangiaceae bacterium]
MQMQAGAQIPGHTFIMKIVQAAEHEGMSQGGGGGAWQVPPMHVFGLWQSLSEQHCAAHTHALPLFIHPPLQVKSHEP